MGSNLFDTGGSLPSYSLSFLPPFWSESQNLYSPRFWLVESCEPVERQLIDCSATLCSSSAVILGSYSACWIQPVDSGGAGCYKFFQELALLSILWPALFLSVILFTLVFPFTLTIRFTLSILFTLAIAYGSLAVKSKLTCKWQRRLFILIL